MVEHRIWDKLNLGPEAVITHIWPQNPISPASFKASCVSLTAERSGGWGEAGRLWTWGAHLHQTWRDAQSCVSGRLMAAYPVLSTSPLIGWPAASRGSSPQAVRKDEHALCCKVEAVASSDLAVEWAIKVSFPPSYQNSRSGVSLPHFRSQLCST